LSERESEALVLLAQGLRNQDIASALYVSEDTIKTHLKRAYRKLGVANRAQATAIALKHPSFTTDGMSVISTRPQSPTPTVAD
jgi:DNA-binding NarL/FixJ family response regulator